MNSKEVLRERIKNFTLKRNHPEYVPESGTAFHIK